MNPWVLILVLMAGFVFGIDYLVRRKKWKDNSKFEKISLLVNMFSVGLYAFLSVLGIFFGIASASPETALGEVLYDVTLTMGGTYYIVAIVAVVLSFVLRKIGKIKLSIWVNIIALLYIVLVFSVNGFAGNIL